MAIKPKQKLISRPALILAVDVSLSMAREHIPDADGQELIDDHQDILTCGICKKSFPLSDIVHFIHHKGHSCNKENFGQCFINPDRDRDNDDGSLPLSTINTRRPKHKNLNTGLVHQAKKMRLPAPSDLCVDGAASSTPKRRASSPLTTSGSTDDGEDHKPTIKQERIDTTNSSPEDPSHKKCRTEVADAESNTTHSAYISITTKAAGDFRSMFWTRVDDDDFCYQLVIADLSTVLRLAICRQKQVKES
ncbi:hypothetical protein HUJ04_012849 [Dendroctonus ponderosae]|nr:hypothetical protein HUJ04_012849 [Dendroctonus ponderosae]